MLRKKYPMIRKKSSLTVTENFHDKSIARNSRLITRPIVDFNRIAPLKLLF